MKKVLVSMILLLALMLLWSTCIKAVSSPELKITSNSYSIGAKMDIKTGEELEVGKTIQLYAVIASLYPADGMEDSWFVDQANLTGVTWTSLEPGNATVDSTGKVTGVQAGEATVTAKYTYEGEEKTAIYSITVKEATSTDEPTAEDPTTSESRADFSKTKLTLSKDGVGDLSYKVENFILDPSDDYTYDLIFTDSATAPTITSDDDLGNIKARGYITKTEVKNGTYEDSTLYNVCTLVEQNKDVYAYIIERYFDKANIKTVFNVKSLGKISKPVEPKYSDAFFATFIADDNTQIVTKFVHGANPRKMQIKIGKITDMSILRKIKNNDISGFADLLNFAKNGSSVYDQIVDSTDTSGFAILYDLDDKGLPLNGKFVDDAYYFLYVKTIDENGKWVSNECVTLGQANVWAENDWSLHFYGDNSFNWVGIPDGDPTVAPTSIPQTGQNVIVAIAIVSVVGLGVYTYRRLKNYRDVI